MIEWIWGYKRGYSNQQIYLALEFYSPDIQERISMGHLWCQAKLFFSGNGFSASEYDF
mgnify:FL=1